MERQRLKGTFTFAVSFYPHISPMRHNSYLLSKWGHWGSENLRMVPKVTYLAADARSHSLNHAFFPSKIDAGFAFIKRFILPQWGGIKNLTHQIWEKDI